VQITFPLYELIGRKARVNLYKSELQSTIDKQDQAKQELVQVIIQEYYSLIYYRNLIGIRSDAQQSTINQYQVAQQEFKDGIIQAAELSRLKSIEVSARADYEEAKREFAILYYQFQNMIGVPMQELIKKK
jgi:outer membrane protein TolC